MTTTDSLFTRLALAVLAVLSLTGLLAPCGCGPAPAPAPGTIAAERLPALQLFSLVEVPELPRRSEPAEIKPTADLRRDERVRWCEPLDQPWCETSSDCPGRQLCVTPWWSGTEGTKVCALAYPSKAERTVVRDKLRVVADDLCEASCSARDLHAFVSALALRESTYRPDKRHRLGPDIAAALEAWREQSATYVGNASYTNPDRWTTGLGLYGQNPALWLRRWDPMAPPETLCGVVESTVALLRRAREHVATLERRGIVCAGTRYYGSACDGDRCGPSWYDASLANSGSQCPSAESLDRWTDRAEAQGLDPLGRVTAASLGRVVPHAGQDAWAAELRTRM